mgnify:CR=1 FL=1
MLIMGKARKQLRSKNNVTNIQRDRRNNGYNHAIRDTSHPSQIDFDFYRMVYALATAETSVQMSNCRMVRNEVNLNKFLLFVLILGQLLPATTASLSDANSQNDLELIDLEKAWEPIAAKLDQHMQTHTASEVTELFTPHEFTILLHKAILVNDSKIVDMALKNGANVNAQTNKALVTPLHWAVHVRNQVILEKLVAAGADVNAFSRDGLTPLAMAVKNNDLKTTRFLLEHGANVDLGSKSPIHLGQTVIFLAISENSPEMLNLLLAHNANVNILLENDYSPLHHAINLQQEWMVEKLLAQGANPNILTPQQGTLLNMAVRNKNTKMVNMLLKAGAHVDAVTNEEQDRPLITAIRNKNAKIVKTLLKNGANVNFIPFVKDSTTPLMAAIHSNDEYLVEILLKAGANPNQEVDYYTPLNMAMRKKNLVVVELLLIHGADINASNNFQSPIEMANNSNNQALKDLINRYVEHKKDQSLEEYVTLENILFKSFSIFLAAGVTVRFFKEKNRDVIDAKLSLINKLFKYLNIKGFESLGYVLSSADRFRLLIPRDKLTYDVKDLIPKKKSSRYSKYNNVKIEISPEMLQEGLLTSLTNLSLNPTTKYGYIYITCKKLLTLEAIEKESEALVLRLTERFFKSHPEKLLMGTVQTQQNVRVKDLEGDNTTFSRINLLNNQAQDPTEQLSKIESILTHDVYDGIAELASAEMMLADYTLAERQGFKQTSKFTNELQRFVQRQQKLSVAEQTIFQNRFNELQAAFSAIQQEIADNRLESLDEKLQELTVQTADLQKKVLQYKADMHHMVNTLTEKKSRLTIAAKKEGFTPQNAILAPAHQDVEVAQVVGEVPQQDINNNNVNNYNVNQESISEAAEATESIEKSLDEFLTRSSSEVPFVSYGPHQLVDVDDRVGGFGFFAQKSESQACSSKKKKSKGKGKEQPNEAVSDNALESGLTRDMRQTLAALSSIWQEWSRIAGSADVWMKETFVREMHYELLRFFQVMAINAKSSAKYLTTNDRDGLTIANILIHRFYDITPDEILGLTKTVVDYLANNAFGTLDLTKLSIYGHREQLEYQNITNVRLFELINEQIAYLQRSQKVHGSVQAFMIDSHAWKPAAFSIMLIGECYNQLQGNREALIARHDVKKLLKTCQEIRGTLRHEFDQEEHPKDVEYSVEPIDQEEVFQLTRRLKDLHHAFEQNVNINRGPR